MVDIVVKRTCQKCGSFKQITSEGKYRCIPCRKSLAAEMYKKHKDKRRVTNKRNYEKNKEERLSYAKDYRDKNRDKINDSLKLYRKSNREVLLAKKKEYYLANKEKLSVKKKEYYNRRHPLRNAWNSMIQRCYNPNHKSYQQYGGRGIVVCDKWRESFDNFVRDMFKTYEKGLTLDRINTNGDYTPKNCRWATVIEQNNNKRNNIKHKLSISDNAPIYYRDSVMSLKEFSDITGIELPALKYRYAQHPANPEWIIDDEYDNRYYKYKGRNYNLTELSFISGISFKKLSDRIRKLNWPIERAMRMS